MDAWGWGLQTRDAKRIATHLNMYTVLHIYRQVLFEAENQSNHENIEKALLSYNFGLIFIGMKEKKIKTADSKKLRFSTPSILFSAESSWIGPWVSSIN